MNSRQVKCPRCGKLSLFSPENPFRPFCCERCKLIDLGQWADEKYSIPVKPATEAGFEEIDEFDEENQEGSSYQSDRSRNDPSGGSSPDGRIH